MWYCLDVVGRVTGMCVPYTGGEFGSWCDDARAVGGGLAEIEGRGEVEIDAGQTVRIRRFLEHFDEEIGETDVAERAGLFVCQKGPRRAVNFQKGVKKGLAYKKSMLLTI